MILTRAQNETAEQLRIRLIINNTYFAMIILFIATTVSVVHSQTATPHQPINWFSLTVGFIIGNIIGNMITRKFNKMRKRYHEIEKGY